MILVTGGGGYVGSHACVELLNAGEQVVVFDNFCNSNPASLDRVQKICGKSLVVIEGDIRDQVAIESALIEYGCTAVLHFAGLKSVQDSVALPLEYYDYNVIGSHRLLRAMHNTGVNKLIFSSSATVYGNPQFLPYTEDHPLNAINPYGRTKLVNHLGIGAGVQRKDFHSRAAADAGGGACTAAIHQESAGPWG